MRKKNEIHTIIQNDEKWYKQINYLISFFAAGIVGLVSVWGILFSQSEPTFKLPIVIIGVFFWMFMVGFLTLDFLFQLQGCLIIKIENKYLIISKEIFSWKWDRTYEVSKIEKLEIVHGRIGAFNSDGYQLRMNYKGVLGILIERKSEKEVREVFRALKNTIFKDK